MEAGWLNGGSAAATSLVLLEQQRSRKPEESDSSNSKGCVSDDGDLHQKNMGSQEGERLLP